MWAPSINVLLDPSCQETIDVVHQVFPVVKGGRRTISGCTINIQDFDPVHTQDVNTPALFGAGWINLISDKAISHNLLKQQMAAAGREIQGDFQETVPPPGRARLLTGGRIGKFGWKGQFATLEEFVGAACANELGLGNPLMERAKPVNQQANAASPTPVVAKLPHKPWIAPSSKPCTRSSTHCRGPSKSCRNPLMNEPRQSVAKNSLSQWVAMPRHSAETWAGSAAFTAISCSTT